MNRSLKGVLLTAGVLAALLYLTGLREEIFLLHFWAKPVPVICLLIMVGYNRASSYKNLVGLGLVFSLIGDMFMSDTDRFLIYGMAAFAVAHVCYISAYLGKSRRRRLSTLAFLIPWFGSLYWKLSPQMGEMKGPVIAYMAVIGMMVWRAGALLTRPLEKWALCAFVGAVVFAISDSMIAFHLFNGPFFGDYIWIILTYWAGQWLIALSTSSA